MSLGNYTRLEALRAAVLIALRCKAAVSGIGMVCLCNGGLYPVLMRELSIKKSPLLSGGQLLLAVCIKGSYTFSVITALRRALMVWWAENQRK